MIVVPAFMAVFPTIAPVVAAIVTAFEALIAAVVAMEVAFAVARCVLVPIPVLLDEIDGAAAGAITLAIPLPLLGVAGRNA
ncbi:MAG: hypothetical protein CVU18_14555, partial [Betaproteobacteria bacterium HGW-Betaproteobacteria-12]